MTDRKTKKVTVQPEEIKEPATVEELQAALAALNTEYAELRNTMLRAQADYENHRKRMRAERDQEATRGRERVLTDLLPVVDDFERALEHDKSDTPFRQGIELIYRQLLGMLKRYDITPMDVTGQKFDPKYHDAVASVTTTDVPEHSIVGEVQRGYMKGNDIFRHARVAVAMKPEKSVAED